MDGDVDSHTLCRVNLNYYPKLLGMCDIDLLPTLNANKILMRIGLHMN